MSEYVKDSTKSTGWKTVSYRKGKSKADGAPITADGMDEGATDAEPEPDSTVEKEWLLD
jgi:hypothetical protein